MKQQLSTGEISINEVYKKINVHVGQNSGETEWYTPRYIIDAAETLWDPSISTHSTKITDEIVKPVTRRAETGAKHEHPVASSVAERVTTGKRARNQPVGHMDCSKGQRSGQCCNMPGAPLAREQTPAGALPGSPWRRGGSLSELAEPATTPGS